MSNEDYVSLEVAKKLKEKGFDELCEYYISESTSQVFYKGRLKPFIKEGHNALPCPTLYEAAKWLRNKHQLHVDVGMCGDYSTDADGNKCDEWNYWTFSSYYTTSLHHMHECEGAFDTYEEALNAGILAALELI